MRQRAKRSPTTTGGVDRFLRQHGGDRQRCAKSLYFLARLDGIADDLGLLLALREEFSVELSRFGSTGWIGRRIEQLEGES